ncbi:hypothetical protein Trydic_g6274 [Trypoxylus dichotomus]
MFVTFKLVKVFGFILWINKSAVVDSYGECGQLSYGKIVGGRDVGKYIYPWFVALTRDDSPRCGGTLITMRCILTAAHCFKPFFKSVSYGYMTLEEAFKPTFGVYNSCRPETTQKVFEVEKVFLHEGFEKEDPYYDIALIRLKENAEGFHPTCLPLKAFDSSTRPHAGHITGLGKKKWRAPQGTCTLQEATVKIYDDDTCRNIINSSGGKGELFIHAFCAGYLEGGIDACTGDSGGPLLYNSNFGYTLLGITATGYECAKPNKLGFYTDVSHFLDWVRSKIGNELPRTDRIPGDFQSTKCKLQTLSLVENTSETETLNNSSSNRHLENENTEEVNSTRRFE